MNAKCKLILGAIGALLAALGGFLGGLLRRNRSSSVQPESPEKITSDAEKQIEQTRTEIKADTDAELAARFNRLAKKKEG
jgi:hypothetical protein